MCKFLLPLFSCLVLSLSPLSAQVVLSLDTTNTNQGSATDGAGVVTSNNWQTTGGTPNFSLAGSVQDQTGAVTGVSASSTGFNLNANGTTVVTADPNTVLFDRGKRIPNNGSASLSFSDLFTSGTITTGLYDVYVYFDSRAENTIGDDLNLTFTLDSTSYYASVPGGVATYTGTFDRVTSTNSSVFQTGNYVQFEAVALDDFTLNIASTGSSNNNNGAVLAGIQIVQIPEPTGAALLGLGMFSVVMGCRRRRRSL